jgi:hypothetical protein
MTQRTLSRPPSLFKGSTFMRVNQHHRIMRLRGSPKRVAFRSNTQAILFVIFIIGACFILF